MQFVLTEFPCVSLSTVLKLPDRSCNLSDTTEPITVCYVIKIAGILRTLNTFRRAERFCTYTQLNRKNRVAVRLWWLSIFCLFIFFTCESPHRTLFGYDRAPKASPEWWNLNTDNTVATTHTLFPLLSPHLPHIFSPSSPPPLCFSQHFCSSCFCGQQAFSLLSAESAKHSHFWTADRLELADRVERLLRKRDIKDEGKGGAREEVSRGKITSHGKNDKKKGVCFPPYRKIPADKTQLFCFPPIATFGHRLSSVWRRISALLSFSSVSQPLNVTFCLPLRFEASASLLLTVLYTFD